MADKGEKSLRRTFGPGSEEFYEFTCDSCLTEKKTIAAKGHCKTCVQNLCTDCITFHEKLAALRNHTIESKLKKNSNQGKQRDGQNNEFTCDSCLTKKKTIEAKGHCQTCVQNLCTDCITFHGKLAALRNHVIESKTTKSSIQGKQQDGQNNDPFIDCCSSHNDELIKFFCHSHKTLACSDCIILNHRNCKDVSHIRDISSDVGTGDEFKTLYTGLQSLEATLVYHKSTTERTKENIIESYSGVVEDIKQLKAELVKKLEQLENSLLESALAMKTEQISSLDKNSSNCQNLMNDTTKQLEDLRDRMKQGHNKRLFVYIKQAQNSILQNLMTKQSESIGEKCRPRRLSFRRNEQFTGFLSTLKSIGEVVLSKEPGDIKVKYERDICVKTKTDKQDCYIPGAVFLPDGRLCLCDFNNKSLKLMETDTMTMSDQLTLPGGPIDATMINDKELAVTIGDKHLQIVCISPTLRLSRTILLPKIYNGIAYCEDKLLLTWWDGINTAGVDICDISGNMIKRIMTDVDGTKLFTYPYRLCVSPDKALIYVTDYRENTVVTMDMEGSVINVYKNDDLKTPTGITVDEDGTVYVCSHNNDTVHQLTRTGHLVKILLNEKDGIEFPKAIAYKAGKLYISSSSKTPVLANNIKVFSLT